MFCLKMAKCCVQHGNVAMEERPGSLSLYVFTVEFRRLTVQKKKFVVVSLTLKFLHFLASISSWHRNQSDP